MLQSRLSEMLHYYVRFTNIIKKQQKQNIGTMKKGIN